MIISITQRIEIDAGHRLEGHEGKCKNVHGHRYAFEVECAGPKLDDVGRVIDFGVIKKVLGGWLDEHWDHGFIFGKGDWIGPVLGEHGKVFELAVPPTAENIAQHFLGVARTLMAPHQIDVLQVTVWETPNCRASAR